MKDSSPVPVPEEQRIANKSREMAEKGNTIKIQKLQKKKNKYKNKLIQLRQHAAAQDAELNRMSQTLGNL